MLTVGSKTGTRPRSCNSTLRVGPRTDPCAAGLVYTNVKSLKSAFKATGLESLAEGGCARQAVHAVHGSVVVGDHAHPGYQLSCTSGMSSARPACWQRVE